MVTQQASLIILRQSTLPSYQVQAIKKSWSYVRQFPLKTYWDKMKHTDTATYHAVWDKYEDI